MHSTARSESASLPPSRAIGNVLFPTYEVVTSSLPSNYLLNEWQVGWHRLSFLLADYTGVIFTLTSRNVTWFYYCNFDFILKMTLIVFIYLFEKDKLIKLALAAWYLKKQKLEFNKHNIFQSYFWIKLIKKRNELMTTLLLKTKQNYCNGWNSSFIMLERERERERKTRALVGLRRRILRSCRALYSFPSSIKSSPD